MLSICLMPRCKPSTTIPPLILYLENGSEDPILKSALVRVYCQPKWHTVASRHEQHRHNYTYKCSFQMKTCTSTTKKLVGLHWGHWHLQCHCDSFLLYIFRGNTCEAHSREVGKLFFSIFEHIFQRFSCCRTTALRIMNLS